MEPFKLCKVINPHRNMPKHIKDAWMNNCIVEELSNNSFVNYTVSEYRENMDENCILVDDWLLANGLIAGENIIILYWW